VVHGDPIGGIDIHRECPIRPRVRQDEDKRGATVLDKCFNAVARCLLRILEKEYGVRACVGLAALRSQSSQDGSAA
jgi:hypothetical protein